MTETDKIFYNTSIEVVQNSIDKVVRRKLEEFHQCKILCCGIIFDCSPEGLNYDGIKASLFQKVGEESVVIQKISISRSKLFKETAEGNFPVTYVQVWYYVNLAK